MLLSQERIWGESGAEPFVSLTVPTRFPKRQSASPIPFPEDRYRGRNELRRKRRGERWKTRWSTIIRVQIPADFINRCSTMGKTIALSNLVLEFSITLITWYRLHHFASRNLPLSSIWNTWPATELKTPLPSLYVQFHAFSSFAFSTQLSRSLCTTFLLKGPVYNPDFPFPFSLSLDCSRRGTFDR